MQSTPEEQLRLRQQGTLFSIRCSFFRSQSEKTNNKRDEKHCF